MTDAPMPTFIWFSGAERADLLTAADWQRVEAELLANPQAGRVIKGLGGARKLRVRVAGRGKSGGAHHLRLPRAGRADLLPRHVRQE